MRRVLAALLCLLWVAIANGQTERVSEDLQRLVLSPDKRASRVIREYDRFENRTRYWTEQTSLLRDLSITAYFSFKGKGAGHNIEGFYLIFTSITPDWRYLKDSRLYFLIDGTRIELGSAKARDNDVKQRYSSVETKEILMFPVKYGTLQKITKANQVEGRLGNTEFKLGPYFRVSLKELLDKVQVAK